MGRQGTVRRRRGERGTELVEFALVMALLTPD